LGFVVSAEDSGNAVQDPQEKPVMKTNRSMTRTLGLLALSLFAGLAVPEAQADSMLPRYRVEDLGPISEYAGYSPRLFEDGRVMSTAKTPWDEYWRHGDYSYSQKYYGAGQLIEHVLKKDGSDVNLMAGVKPADTKFRDFNAVGQYLAIDSGNTDTANHEYVFDTTTGSKSFVNLSGFGEEKPQVLGMNSMGNLVGHVGVLPGGPQAIFYESATSQAILLSSLIDGTSNWLLKTAGDINDAGEIVGIGSDLNLPYYNERAFKLVPITPVPEPGTFLIFASASTIYGYRRWRI
jgi:hypothetical protein